MRSWSDRTAGVYCWVARQRPLAASAIRLPTWSARTEKGKGGARTKSGDNSARKVDKARPHGVAPGMRRAISVLGFGTHWRNQLSEKPTVIASNGLRTSASTAYWES